MIIKEGTWDAARVFQALGRIGYDPVSAILDIVDNSVSVGATKVMINVNQESEIQQEGQRGRPKAILKSFYISDNGCGMDENGLANALTLGSSPEQYSEHTLSKFGMGLKTAAASLGKRLEIISRPENEMDRVFKAVLDQDSISEEGKYIYELTSPTEEDLVDLDACARGDSGTLIRITKLHHDSLPRTAEIIEGLKNKAGVIYFYFLRGLAEDSQQLTLEIDGDKILPVDPLFVDEIGTEDADLDEDNWNGLSPKWITKPQRIQVDTTETRSAEVAIVQLPHPPTVGRTESIPMTQKDCRDRYLIGSGNYGFYVYRNWRLISWADSLGFVTRNQDLYAFRGRLLINSDSDDVLNIDVTKSRIHLSEISHDQLRPLIREAVKKSIAAWNRAKRETVRITQQGPHDTANAALDRSERLQVDADKRDMSITPPETRKELEERLAKAISAKPITPEISQHVVETGDRVIYVNALNNNQLLERASDPTHGLVVKINKSHSFCQDILNSVSENGNLLKIIDVLVFSLARSEHNLVYKSVHDEDQIERIMDEYRERVGATLLDVIRTLNLDEFLTEV